MAATHANATRPLKLEDAPGADGIGSRFGSATPTFGIPRVRNVSFWVCIIAIVAFSLLPKSTAAQSDYRIPQIRGIHAITISINTIVDGSGMAGPSPCRLDRAVLERHGTEILHNAGLDAIGSVDKFTKLRALQSETSKALGDLEKAPRDGKSHWDREQSERRTREGEFLASQPFLFVHIGVATLDGDLCAAGITTELRVFSREKPVINYNSEQVFAPLALWEAAPLALAVPTAELDRAVSGRLDTQIKAFITAWSTANGR